MKKVLVKGFFENNFGDDLFLKVLVDRYPNTKFYISSTSDYDYFFKKYKNFFIFKKYNILYIIKTIFNKLMKIIKSDKVYRIESFIKFDEIITVTGSLFMENSDTNLNEIKSNYDFKNVRYTILGCNFGPYISNDFLDLHHDSIFKNAFDVCFRDLYSYKLFKDLKNVRHAPDIVFNLDLNDIKNNNSKCVVFSIMNCNKDNTFRIDENLYIAKCIELINFYKKNNYSIKLVSFSKKQGDEDIIEKILKQITLDNISKYYYRGNIDECLNYIADCEIIIGTRYHANILGLLFNKKTLPISYSKKTDDALYEVGFNEKIVHLSEFSNLSIDDEFEIFKPNIDIEKVIFDASKQFSKLDEILK